MCRFFLPSFVGCSWLQLCQFAAVVMSFSDIFIILVLFVFAIVYAQHRWNENQTLNALNHSFQLYKVVRRHEHEPFCGWCWAQSKFSFFNYVSRCSHQPDWPETIFTIFLCVIIFVSFLLPRSLNFAFSFCSFGRYLFPSGSLARCRHVPNRRRLNELKTRSANTEAARIFHPVGSRSSFDIVRRLSASLTCSIGLIVVASRSLCVYIYAHKSDCSGNCRKMNDDDRRLQSGRWLFVFQFFQIS